MKLIIHQAYILKTQLGKEWCNMKHGMAADNAADFLKFIRELSNPWDC